MHAIEVINCQMEIHGITRKLRYLCELQWSNFGTDLIPARYKEPSPVPASSLIHSHITSLTPSIPLSYRYRVFALCYSSLFLFEHRIVKLTSRTLTNL